MASVELEIARSGSSEFIVQTLPDGSTAIFEVATKNVYSLNPSAAAAWEVCASPTTLTRLAARMSERLNAPVTEDLAHEAVSELQAVGLVAVTPGERLGTSRRAMLRQAAGVAIPVVLVLTGAEQRAHAQGAGSELTTTGITPPPLTTTGGVTTTPTPSTATGTFYVIKGVGAEQPVALAGAEFEIRNAQNTVVAQLVSGADGKTNIVTLPAGQYTLVETFAPGGPYEPFATVNFTVSPNNETFLNRRNIPIATAGA